MGRSDDTLVERYKLDDEPCYAVLCSQSYFLMQRQEEMIWGTVQYSTGLTGIAAGALGKALPAGHVLPACLCLGLILF